MKQDYSIFHVLSISAWRRSIPHMERTYDMRTTYIHKELWILGYIPLHSADQIVNDRSKKGSLAQQGLLASAPTAARPGSTKIRRTAKRNKRGAATAQFFQTPDSLALPALPEFTEEAYRAHWTGSMACLDMANVLEKEVHGPADVDYLDTTYMGETQSHGFVDSMAGADLVDWNSFVPHEEYQEAILNIFPYSPPLF